MNSSEESAIYQTRQEVQHLPVNENWLGRMTEWQRGSLKSSGQRLMALLLQYSGRDEGGEAFLKDGRRITGDYCRLCEQLGFTLRETVQVFLFFRRSILDAILETGDLGGCEDYEGQRLFRRTNDFLDEMLVTLITQYMESPEAILNRRTLSPCK